ncbi:acyl-CoA dehydrogenase family protein, partial [Nocardia farcinica]
IEDHLQTRVRPHLTRYWDAEEFAFDLLPGLAELGLGRLVLDGSSSLFQQLVHAEIARVDLSLSALVGIHNELNLGMIAGLGSERQKATWQGRLESFDALGAFCLTEPDHGSDIAGGLATTATRDGDEWVIRGAKRWIGAGTIA